MKNRQFHTIGNTESFVVLLSHTKRFIVTTKIETSPCTFYKKPNIEKAKGHYAQKATDCNIHHTKFIAQSEISRKKTAKCGFLAVFSFIWSQSLDG